MKFGTGRFIELKISFIVSSILTAILMLLIFWKFNNITISKKDSVIMKLQQDLMDYSKIHYLVRCEMFFQKIIGMEFEKSKLYNSSENERILFYILDIKSRCNKMCNFEERFQVRGSESRSFDNCVKIIMEDKKLFSNISSDVAKDTCVRLCNFDFAYLGNC